MSRRFSKLFFTYKTLDNIERQAFLAYSYECEFCYDIQCRTKRFIKRSEMLYFTYLQKKLNCWSYKKEILRNFVGEKMLN